MRTPAPRWDCNEVVYADMKLAQVFRVGSPLASAGSLDELLSGNTTGHMASRSDARVRQRIAKGRARSWRDNRDGFSKPSLEFPAAPAKGKRMPRRSHEIVSQASAVACFCLSWYIYIYICILIFIRRLRHLRQCGVQ